MMGDLIDRDVLCAGLNRRVGSPLLEAQDEQRER